MGVAIVGTGSYLPEVLVTNEDIARMQTDFDPVRARGSVDEWCRRKTGAVVRHYVSPGEGTSDMATEAARRALQDAQLTPHDIDVMVLSTTSGDYRMPQAASLVQENLGAHFKFVQLDAGCSGFVDGLMTTHAMMERVGYERALVIGCETMSALINPGDFKALATFGDGAGAVVLSRLADPRYGIKSYSCGSDGEMGFTIWIPGGGMKAPLTPHAIGERAQYVSMDFAPIGPYAVEKMVQSTLECVERAGIALEDVKCVVPHQASTNILMDVARRLGLPEDMFVVIFDHAGNTSSASIPIALDEANRAGRFADGDYLVLPAVGIGMAWGAACLVWHDYRSAHGRVGVGAAKER